MVVMSGMVFLIFLFVLAALAFNVITSIWAYRDSQERQQQRIFPYCLERYIILSYSRPYNLSDNQERLTILIY
jgi:hypothetical protein